ncbi:MAG TPA: thiolase family protein [Acidimicrobiia bacterium]|nr:thiolase family protein [Acidimicrobiia bacterium]
MTPSRVSTTELAFNDPAFGAEVLGRAAIAGLGITATGKVYGRSAGDFAAEAVRLAVADAGLTLDDVDGLLLSNGISGGVEPRLQKELGLRNLRLMNQMASAGATAIAQVQYAALAVATGLASAVVCVHADAPLEQPGESSGAVYGARRRGPRGLGAVGVASGLRGANGSYALAARRHMERFGTTSEHLGAIAVAQRAWATMNERAQFRDPITIADHQASRWIAEPLHLLDCCMVSNGGIAVLVTSADRARDLAQPPVHLWGAAQTHPGYTMARGCEFGFASGAAISGPAAMTMAGITPADVDVAELYDCYTYTALLTLEDYGFCAKGEGGPFAASGVLSPGGSLPLNTGGGQLSSFYLWGMTPLSEAVIQARGQGGARQVPRHDVIVASGNGGILDHHGTLVLSPQVKS